MVPEDVLIRELSRESVILNLDSEQYFGLDEVGTQMLHHLSQSDSIQAAYERLLAEYDVEPAVLRQDLEMLIEHLLVHHLVKLDRG